MSKHDKERGYRAGLHGEPFNEAASLAWCGGWCEGSNDKRIFDATRERDRKLKRLQARRLTDAQLAALKACAEPNGAGPDAHGSTPWSNHRTLDKLLALELITYWSGYGAPRYVATMAGRKHLVDNDW